MSGPDYTAILKLKKINDISQDPSSHYLIDMSGLIPMCEFKSKKESTPDEVRDLCNRITAKIRQVAFSTIVQDKANSSIYHMNASVPNGQEEIDLQASMRMLMNGVYPEFTPLG